MYVCSLNDRACITVLGVRTQAAQLYSVRTQAITFGTPAQLHSPGYGSSYRTLASGSASTHHATCVAGPVSSVLYGENRGFSAIDFRVITFDHEYVDGDEHLEGPFVGK